MNRMEMPREAVLGIAGVKSKTGGILDQPRPLVLIVDDEAEVREIVGLLLKDNYEILFARNGRQALEVVSRRSPDLILTDIQMPSVNGWDTIQKIRGMGTSMPIIVITGYPEGSDQSRADEFGVVEYLVKPFSLLHLRGLIREYTRSVEH
jgi:CheY-like chemotaxis protein